MSVRHKSEEGVHKIKDSNASVLNLGDFIKIDYLEADGSSVSLNISESSMSMKRVGEWKTIGLFHKDETSSLDIVSEEGVLKFDVKVIEWKLQQDLFYIAYELLHNGSIIDEHRFECSWELEV